jgi:hypothetical protein
MWRAKSGSDVLAPVVVTTLETGGRCAAPAWSAGGVRGKPIQPSRSKYLVLYFPRMTGIGVSATNVPRTRMNAAVVFLEKSGTRSYCLAPRRQADPGRGVPTLPDRAQLPACRYIFWRANSKWGQTILGQSKFASSIAYGSNRVMSNALELGLRPFGPAK